MSRDGGFSLKFKRLNKIFIVKTGKFFPSSQNPSEKFSANCSYVVFFKNLKNLHSSYDMFGSLVYTALLYLTD